jgi:hypothetical protein
MVPSLPFVSATMTAVPFPKALATPAFCEPEVTPALLFVVTGKTLGADVIH